MMKRETRREAGRRLAVYKYWFDTGAAWITAPMIFVTLTTLLYDKVKLFVYTYAPVLSVLVYLPVFLLIMFGLGMFLCISTGKLLAKFVTKRYLEYGFQLNPFYAEKLTPKEAIVWESSILNTRLVLRFLMQQGFVKVEEKGRLEELLEQMEELLHVT